MVNERDDISDRFVRMPGKHWSLVQTRPRNEKCAAQNCSRQGIIVYLPLITKVEIHNRSKREILLPMFPGYLFACPDYEEETLIRRDKCVWNLKVLSDAEEDCLIYDLKIVRESEILSRNHKLVVNPRLRKGDTVRLKNGPFKDHEVIVVQRENESKVVVNLNFFCRNIVINCNADDLIY
jgi:Transcription antiterminator